MPSAYTGARSIEELAAALTKMSYTPRSEEERRSQSENLYRNQLDQAMRSAQQSYNRSDLALQNQLAGLATSTQRQIDAQRQNTAAAISQQDRLALQRGMQRSTYNNATIANLASRGAEAEAKIQQNRTDTENTIAAQRALLAQELGENQSAANAQFQANVLANMDKLEQQDYERQLAADKNNNATQLQLYEAFQQEAARQQAQQQFEAGQTLQREQMSQNQNQFDLKLALDREAAAESQRQFNENLALNREKLLEDQRQFNEQLALNREKAAGAASSGGGGGYGGGGGSSGGGVSSVPAVPSTPRDYGYTGQNILEITPRGNSVVFTTGNGKQTKKKTISAVPLGGIGR